MRKTVVLSSAAWVLVISSLHAALNFDLFRHERKPERTFKVGFLPVTCHLTCPVTDFATKTSGSTRFTSQRFTDFPTVVEEGNGVGWFLLARLLT